ncbi:MULTISPECIES: hypothetical protein [Roseomonadaceae]|uniref:SPOR domain-containing protein n=1 Tax=Falsiroseomonas oleicola TaxID=2801474 RepID=A0ABS6H5R4_9PROT|nr:hypothetical protein [Roseomonas oleicola]MBU8544024.1 hypothetical protein [Roseomonas oleicola]
MAITVNSSQWTGESSESAKGVPVVWGEFASDAARDAAIAHLKADGAKRQTPTTDTDRPVSPPDENPEEADLRNRRQLGVGMSMAATAMGAAGLVIASGGALLPAVAAAAAAGAGAGLAGEAVAGAVTEDQQEGARLPPSDAPLIGLRAPDEATRHAAEAALRDAGAINIIIDED